MDHTIIFNHIPRTGGTTLRVILNRVYGESRVFFINSRNIPSSLAEYNSLSQEDQSDFKVISGHGALHFHPRQGNNFLITILREPISLFISQFHYLRKSPDSNFLKDVSALSSFEAYIDYAIEHGQDNMMVRCLDPENKQFTLAGAVPPKMEDVGRSMLERAMSQLENYNLIMDLSSFDEDLFSLAIKLGWKRIPLYRPRNKATYNKTARDPGIGLLDRLKDLLRYDVELYRYFNEEIQPSRKYEKSRGPRYQAFRARQSIIRLLF